MMNGDFIKALLVEDNPGDVHLVREMLADAVTNGLFPSTVDLVHVERLSEAFQRLGKEHFDVVLLDLSLPDSQGLDTFARAHAQVPGVPIVVLTGLADVTIGVKAVREGAQDYLVKGQVDGNLLVRAMRYAIERKRAEEEKAKLQAQLTRSQRMESIGRLAGGIAHDFNNLLAIIQGQIYLMMKTIDENDLLYQNLEEIHRASTRAAKLVDQLLLFSRKQPMELTSLDMSQMIQDLLEMLKCLIGEEIAIRTDLAPDLWMVQVDEESIERVIMNLTINARDAMPEGGALTFKTENVTLDEEECQAIPEARPGKFVCLSVADTGVGMDPATIPQIFEPFFTTKEFGKGTGLGLSVVYGIARQHQGWIQVASEPGQGSTFKVYLPAFSGKLEEDEDGSQDELLA